MSWLCLFESRVILDGSQTPFVAVATGVKFESRVILDGSQTSVNALTNTFMFESRVILDGSQTLLFLVFRV